MAESLRDGEGGEGVLLYYKYADVPDVAALASFYESRCRALGLLGRVRVAPHGVNVTVSPWPLLALCSDLSLSLVFLWVCGI